MKNLYKKYQKFSLKILLCSALILLPGCAKEILAEVQENNHDVADSNKIEEKTSFETKNVRTVSISKGSLTESAVAHGITSAKHSTVYSAQIAGKIEYMGFELGDEVKKGQILTRINFFTQKAQATSAQSQYELSNTTYSRIFTLKEEDLISAQQYDEAKWAQVNAKAQMEIAKADLAKSTIRAESSGIVAAKYMNKAEYAAPGSRLYQLVDYQKIIVLAQLAQSQISAVRNTETVEVIIDALDKKYEGTLLTILPAADEASRTFTARIEIENSDLEILIGMSARISIPTLYHDEVIIIPQNAVLEDQSGARYVFVANENKAEKKEIVTGPRKGNQVIIKKGLKEEQQLIILGHRDLEHGQTINIQN